MRFSNDVEQEVYGLNYLENSVSVITHLCLCNQNKNRQSVVEPGK